MPLLCRALNPPVTSHLGIPVIFTLVNGTSCHLLHIPQPNQQRGLPGSRNTLSSLLIFPLPLPISSRIFGASIFRMSATGSSMKRHRFCPSPAQSPQWRPLGTQDSLCCPPVPSSPLDHTGLSHLWAHKAYFYPRAFALAIHPLVVPLP